MANHAVIVGVSGYFDARIDKLPHVPHAVAELSRALVEFGSFDREHVALLVDSGDHQDPLTLPLKYSTIASLLHPPDLRADDCFLFYFIGHGLGSLSGDRLLTLDTSFIFTEETSLPVETVAQLVRRLPAARKMMVFDACRNIVRGAQDVTYGVGKTVPEGLVTLYACQPDERAWVPQNAESSAPSLPLLTEGFIRAVKDGSCRSLRQMNEAVSGWVTEHSFEMRVYQTPDLSVAGLDPDTTGFLSRDVMQVATESDATRVDAQIRDVRNGLEELYKRTYPQHFPRYGVPLAAAKPLRKLVVGPGTYRKLAFEFLETGEDADLYTVAYMARAKPDPILLEPMLETLSRRTYRGTAVWQALDAIATLLATGTLRERSKTETALRDVLAGALKRAAAEHPTRKGSPFSTAMVWGKVLQICRLAGIPEDQVMPAAALEQLSEGRA